MRRSIALLLPSLTFAAIGTAQRAPALQATRDLAIDGAAGNIADRNTRVAVSSNGTIAFAPVLGTSIVLVDRDSKRLRVFGQGGTKAGDINVFQWFGWIADSLWVGDPTLNRLTVFRPDMSVARTEQLPPRIQGPPGTRVVPHGDRPPLVTAVYGDGTLLVNESLLVPKGNSAIGYYVRVSRDGAFNGTMGLKEAGNAGCRYPPDSLPVSGMSLFCGSPPSAVSPDGRFKVTVVANTGRADSNQFSVTSVDEYSKTRFAREYPFAPVAVTAHELDSAIIDRSAGMESFPGGWNAALSQRYDRALRTSAGVVHPPILAVHAGNDGTIWIERFSADSGHHWLLLDSDGEPIGAIVLPGDVRLKEVSRRTVWGEQLRSDGSASIVRYQISPTARP